MIIAGTGHRPKYCPCKYKDFHPWLTGLKTDLKSKLIEHNPSVVISGMAIGWDTWLAQIALELKIDLYCYIPFPEQGNAWPRDSKKEYDRILSLSKTVKVISEKYSNESFFLRDKAMVNDADLIFSLLNPEFTSGGTYFTVEYAREQGKPILNFWRD